MPSELRSWISYFRSRLRRGDFGSSLSDNEWYPAYCESAATDDALFMSFRRDPRYAEILEHVQPSLGRRYLQRALSCPEVAKALSRVCSADTVGGPRLHDFGEGVFASPTTLRYLSVACDLLTAFGPLSQVTVVEIGVGYGGQCRVLAAIDPPASWTLVDLPQVLSLAARFLEESDVVLPLYFASAFDESSISADLLISNYAFSELRRDQQDAYMHRIIRHAKRGYVTFNQISPRSFNSISAEEFAELVDGSVHRERPLSYPGNKVVTWSRA